MLKITLENKIHNLLLPTLIQNEIIYFTFK